MAVVGLTQIGSVTLGSTTAQRNAPPGPRHVGRALDRAKDLRGNNG